MKIVESQIISKEVKEETNKVNALNQKLHAMHNDIRANSSKIYESKQNSEEIEKNIKAIGDSLSESFEKVVKNYSIDLSDNKKVLKSTQDGNKEVNESIQKLKNEYIDAIGESNKLIKKLTETVKANSVESEIVDISKQIEDVIDLLKKIEKKKTTTQVIGGGGGSNVPLTQSSTGKTTVPITNPDGTNIGNTLGVPVHNNGEVTYPNGTTEIYTFKQDSTPVGIVTITYTDSTKAKMSTWSYV